MRARAICAALALNLLIAPAAAQTEEPQLPAELRKPAPIFEVPLPDAPPLVLEKPAPRPVVEKPAPPRMKPRGECVIKPVMSDDDLYNCGALR